MDKRPNWSREDFKDCLRYGKLYKVIKPYNSLGVIQVASVCFRKGEFIINTKPIALKIKWDLREATPGVLLFIPTDKKEFPSIIRQGPRQSIG